MVFGRLHFIMKYLVLQESNSPHIYPPKKKEVRKSRWDSYRNCSLLLVHYYDCEQVYFFMLRKAYYPKVNPSLTYVTSGFYICRRKRSTTEHSGQRSLKRGMSRQKSEMSKITEKDEKKKGEKLIEEEKSETGRVRKKCNLCYRFHSQCRHFKVQLK